MAGSGSGAGPCGQGAPCGYGPPRPKRGRRQEAAFLAGSLLKAQSLPIGVSPEGCPGSPQSGSWPPPRETDPRRKERGSDKPFYDLASEVTHQGRQLPCYVPAKFKFQITDKFCSVTVLHALLGEDLL